MSNETSSWGYASSPTIWDRDKEPSYVRRQVSPTGENIEISAFEKDSLAGTSGRLAVLGASQEFRDETEIKGID